MMQISSYDICTPGFEHLRSQDEFILLASVSAESLAEDIRAALLADVQCCQRAVGFDHKAARSLVESFYREILQPAFATPNPFHLDPTPDGGVTLFLFVREGDDDAS